MADPLYGYLQHGTAPDPVRTERVPVMHDYADRYRAWYDGNWRRVYVQVGRTYIRYHKRTITILIAGTPV